MSKDQAKTFLPAGLLHIHFLMIMKSIKAPQELPELFDVAQNFSQNLTLAKRLRGESSSLVINFAMVERWKRSLEQSPTRVILVTGLLTGLLASLFIAAGMTGIRVYRTRKKQRHPTLRAA